MRAVCLCFSFCRWVASFGLGWLLGGFLFVGGVWGLRAHPVGGVILFVVGAGSFVLVWLGVLC